MDAVLIELDGVLADTARTRRDALQRALADDQLVLTGDDADALQVAFVQRDVERARRLLATSRGADINALDDTALELLAMRAARYASEALGAGVTLVQGARELVHALSSRMRLAVFTFGLRRDIEIVLTLAELESSFAGVASSEDATAANGYSVPAALLARLARRTPFESERTLVLATTPGAVAQARACGLRTVAVGPMPAHRALEAHAYLPTLDAVSVAALHEILAGGAHS